MRVLVDHLLKYNREQVLARSLMNCHLPFVHSIMLLESPGRTIRLFVAEPGHALDDNNPRRFEKHQSVAFHAHHCELTLLPIMGVVENWLVAPSPKGWFTAQEYEYQSAITKGEIGFRHCGDTQMDTIEYCRLPIGKAKYLPATAIHTIAVPSGDWAAWFVFEGRENPSHNNHCWSMTPLENQDFSNLYKPMTDDDLKRLIKTVGGFIQ